MVDGLALTPSLSHPVGEGAQGAGEGFWSCMPVTAKYVYAPGLAWTDNPEMGRVSHRRMGREKPRSHSGATLQLPFHCPAFVFTCLQSGQVHAANSFVFPAGGCREIRLFDTFGGMEVLGFMVASPREERAGLFGTAPGARQAVDSLSLPRFMR